MKRNKEAEKYITLLIVTAVLVIAFCGAWVWLDDSWTGPSGATVTPDVESQARLVNAQSNPTVSFTLVKQ